ncbi:MAG: YidC/Oxa1 family membrane protein insertase [Chloroflexota bacterium]|nr:YidC/Oxa1 family membrane protein insertase [Chloroflexota bacterium]
MVGEIWDLIILSPMINVLIVVSGALFNNFGLSIIALTIIVRGITMPLTLKQTRSTKALQELQPKMSELQQKFGKDKQKLAQEQMRLYKESGVNPAGCLLPMLVQLPVWIALFQSIIRVLAVVPEDFLKLSGHLYSAWPQVFSLVPLNSKFLWLDLAVPDRFLMLPILVGGTMWLSQKMVTPRTGDPKQQAQSTMMLWVMPLMFAFITMQFPSGLALYWVVSNVIQIGMQYFITGGWGGLSSQAAKPAGRDKRYLTRITMAEEKVGDYTATDSDIGADVGADIAVADMAPKEGTASAKYQPGLRAMKRHPKKSKRPKRR